MGVSAMEYNDDYRKLVDEERKRRRESKASIEAPPPQVIEFPPEPATEPRPPRPSGVLFPIRRDSGGAG